MPDQNPVPNSIPSSSALEEVTLDSLSEAISRFDHHIKSGTQGSPEAKRALKRIIEDNREQRVRWETTERETPQKGRQILAKKSNLKASDLGI